MEGVVSLWMKLMCGVISPTGKRNDEENAKEKLYTYASHVPVESFKVSFVHFMQKTFC